MRHRLSDTQPTTKLSNTGSSLQAPQLSPLSGAYLLIVVGEPFSEEHKKLILNKLQQGKIHDELHHYHSNNCWIILWSNPITWKLDLF